MIWLSKQKIYPIYLKNFWHAIGIVFSLKLSLESSNPVTLKVYISNNEILTSGTGPDHKEKEQQQLGYKSWAKDLTLLTKPVGY